MKGRRQGLWLVLAAGLATGCLDAVGTTAVPRGGSIQPRLTPADMRGYWIAHVSGGRFDPHVQVFQVLADSASAGTLQILSHPARSWIGDPTLDFPPSGVGHFADDTVRLVLGKAAADSLVIAAELLNDTLTGVAADSSGAHPFVGIRVDARTLDWVASRLTPVRSQPGSVPRVVLRLDDAPYTDRDFTNRLIARGLVAEIAVPTNLIGASNRLSWADLTDLASLGFGMSAHSRNHVPATVSPGDFLFEVIGSLNDLAAHGLTTGGFVQPGSWRDSLNFDDVGKLAGWHGALMRTITDVFEDYIYEGSLTPTDSLRWRLGSNSISDEVDSGTVLQRWRAAVNPDRVTVFQVHTISLVPDMSQLDWFLDSLAAANASGRIRLYGSSTDALSDVIPFPGHGRFEIR